MKDKYSLRRVSRPFNLGRDSNPQELPIIFTLAKKFFQRVFNKLTRIKIFS